MKRVTCCLTLAVTAALIPCLLVGVAHAECLEARAPDPAEFSSPQDNLYFPRAIGSVYVYEAETEDELIHNEISITSDTKTIHIDGDIFDCTVVHDVEWISPDGGATWFKTEETEDWYAWDNDGNAWYFGEATVEYLFDDDWNPIGSSTEGSWEAGVDGALPGIIMPANPAPGMCYQQEYYEGEAEDMGKVLKLNASVSIEYGDFDDCLATKEWTPLGPGVIEHKYYAPGVGLVYVEELKGKTLKVELIDIH